MTDWLRRAGRGTLPDGSTVIWSVASGRRGRRWREVRTGEAGVISSLLLETDPAGRFARMELSTAAGLVTLHPERDGTLHGNAVMADGVRHVIGLPWDPEGSLVVEGSPIARAAARRGGGEATVATVTLKLEVLPGAIGDGRTQAISDLDGDGLPRLIDGAIWPLELEGD